MVRSFQTWEASEEEGRMTRSAGVTGEHRDSRRQWPTLQGRSIHSCDYHLKSPYQGLRARKEELPHHCFSGHERSLILLRNSIPLCFLDHLIFSLNKFILNEFCELISAYCFSHWISTIFLA